MTTLSLFIFLLTAGITHSDEGQKEKKLPLLDMLKTTKTVQSLYRIP